MAAKGHQKDTHSISVPSAQKWNCSVIFIIGRYS